MPAYTVEQAAKKMDKPDTGYGPMMVMSLMLKDEQGAVTAAEWFTRATTPIPGAGSQLQGDLTNGKFGWQFKKASAGGFGGAPRPEDPKRARAIQRMHSQTAAVTLVAAKAQAGLATE